MTELDTYQPQRCGTVRGYFDHRNAGEPTCTDCRKAKREYQSERSTDYGICVITDCDAPVEARGWCPRHLRMFYRHGTIEHRRPTVEDRFWVKVTMGEPPVFAPHLDACWIWSGTRDVRGYGVFTCPQTYVHRFVYEYMVAEIPDDLTIDHLCMVRACVNPGHLEPVTRAENSRREMAARYGS